MSNQLNPRRYLKGVTYPILKMCHCTECKGTKWISHDGTKWTRQTLGY